MNTGLLPRLHPRKSSPFMLSWSAGASATRTTKAQDTKRALKLNFPAIRRRTKFFEPWQIYIHAWREIALCLPDSSENAWILFVNKPESALFWPERPTLIFFWLPRNRIKLMLNMLNFPILCDLFSISTSYCTNEGKMFKKLIILKGSVLLDVKQIKFRDLLLTVTLIGCAS